ncbi:MAG: tetratricopeptide repeat protein [Candidatus Eisenbacteria bacterium]|uniref:Tetratricopeptide repeat protein n=1 Tax=Eiseniibacteriota bacterium TaxID=2212470 RepID=A0A937X9H2_UNCEI|nr:tetratricopeptide repeat protein [Candidatus Eisenbacteria bacterium]
MNRLREEGGPQIGAAGPARCAARLLLGALLWAAPPGAGAQAPDARPKAPVEIRAPGQAETIRRAELLLRQRQADQAVQLLEPLHAERPDDMRLILALSRAYQEAGATPRAIELLRGALAGPARRDPGLWIELSRLHEREGAGEAAARVLLDALREHPGWSSDLRDRFEVLAADSVAGRAVLRELAEAARKADAPLAWIEILGHVQAAHGQPAQALESLMRVARRRPEEGRLVLDLAQTLARSDRPDLAVAAFDSVLALDPRAGIVEQSWFEKGWLLESLGRPGDAAAAYLVVEERFPRGSLAPRAALRRAAMLLAAGETTAARSLLEALLARAEAAGRRSDMRVMGDEIRLALADCALRQREFAAARETLEPLIRTAARAEIREQAAFELAETLLFEGRLSDAEQAYYALADEFPSGQWVNDALARVLLLGEHGSAGAALSAYAGVLYQQRIGDREGALALCREAIGEGAELPLHAELRLEEVRLLAGEKRWAEADSALALLLARHPSSRAAARALLFLGKASLAEPARAGLAREYLERLVLGHPASYEARRARSLLADLRRGDVHS